MKKKVISLLLAASLALGSNSIVFAADAELFTAPEILFGQEENYVTEEEAVSGLFISEEEAGSTEALANGETQTITVGENQPLTVVEQGEFSFTFNAEPGVYLFTFSPNETDYWNADGVNCTILGQTGNTMGVELTENSESPAIITMEAMGNTETISVSVRQIPKVTALELDESCQDILDTGMLGGESDYHFLKYHITYEDGASETVDMHETPKTRYGCQLGMSCEPGNPDTTYDVSVLELGNISPKVSFHLGTEDAAQTGFPELKEGETLEKSGFKKLYAGRAYGFWVQPEKTGKYHVTTNNGWIRSCFNLTDRNKVEFNNNAEGYALEENKTYFFVMISEYEGEGTVSLREIKEVTNLEIKNPEILASTIIKGTPGTSRIGIPGLKDLIFKVTYLENGNSRVKEVPYGWSGEEEADGSYHIDSNVWDLDTFSNESVKIKFFIDELGEDGISCESPEIKIVEASEAGLQEIEAGIKYTQNTLPAAANGQHAFLFTPEEKNWGYSPDIFETANCGLLCMIDTKNQEYIEDGGELQQGRTYCGILETYEENYSVRITTSANEEDELPTYTEADVYEVPVRNIQNEEFVINMAEFKFVPQDNEVYHVSVPMECFEENSAYAYITTGPEGGGFALTAEGFELQGQGEESRISLSGIKDGIEKLPVTITKKMSIEIETKIPSITPSPESPADKTDAGFAEDDRIQAENNLSELVSNYISGTPEIEVKPSGDVNPQEKLQDAVQNKQTIDTGVIIAFATEPTPEETEEAVLDAVKASVSSLENGTVEYQMDISIPVNAGEEQIGTIPELPREKALTFTVNLTEEQMGKKIYAAGQHEETDGSISTFMISEADTTQNGAVFTFKANKFSSYFLVSSENVKVTYQNIRPNGGEETVTVKYGAKAENKSVSAANYRFLGWYDDTNKKWDFSNPVTKNLILRGEWKYEAPVTPPSVTWYTVIFDSQGGSSVPSVSGIYGSRITAPTAPTRQDYIFEGWYKEAACTNEWDFEKDCIKGSMTLYAKWKETEKEPEEPEEPKKPEVKDFRAKTSAISILLRWNQVEGADGYIIKGRTRGDADFTWKKVLNGGDVLSFKVTNLAGGTIKEYVITPFVLTNGKRVYGKTSEILTAVTMPTRPAFKEISSKKGYVKAVIGKKSTGADGYEYAYSKKSAEWTEAEDYKLMGKTANTSCTSKKIAAGIYVARVRAYKDVDGRRIYGSWSQDKWFEVPSGTLAAPKILSVKAAGRTVTVTLKGVDGAAGYDCVLGTTKNPVKPTPYKYVVTNRKTTTIIFKNVKKGTYYVGAHAYQKVKGKKTFSKWSNQKKVTIS